jgi:thiamine-phosphate pyrophosphorylase
VIVWLPPLQGIYAIVNAKTPKLVDFVSALLDGGIRIVQYRAKRGVAAQELRAVRELTRKRGALLIVNDDWQAAIDIGADGAHLGPEDAGRAQLPMIREYLHGRMLGLSCGTSEEARYAESLGADYIGVGSVFATASKPDAGEPIGLHGLAQIASATRLPVAAIGGINAQNIGAVRACGVAMAAVISALGSAPDPRVAATELVQQWALL